MTEPYRIVGAIGSPYSVKLRAVLRYRRLPHQWQRIGPDGLAETGDLKPRLAPALCYPDGTWRHDTTPLILDLEQRHPDARSVLPDDPADSFLALLLEDMADEWGTKWMFHYRWWRQRDRAYCRDWLTFDRYGATGEEALRAEAQSFNDRQVGRMALVGCTRQNRPLIEETYHQALGHLEALVTSRPFFFGGRPSIADFAWYGQLLQLATDPTPADLMKAEAPFLERWLYQIDDASGVAGDWRDPSEPLGPPLMGLLHLVGEVYLPFLAANAAAFEHGRDRFAFEALGHDYAQPTFRYQVKCLRGLRDAFAALDPASRARLEPILAETGCLAHLAT